MGRWKYIIFFGLLCGGSVFFLIQVLINFILGNELETGNYLTGAVTFGVFFGFFNWTLSERRYKKYKRNQ